MQNYIINGSSSLLFIISTTKAFYCSSLLWWKVTNAFLVIASFLCNATEYHPIYMQMDYLAIYLVCISYMNHSINILYTLLLIYEYKTYKSIETVKNVVFACSVTKSMVRTYLHVDAFHYKVLLLSSISGIIIYKIRYYLLHHNITKYKLLLTYMFHLCIMNILYVSSITA